MRVNCRGGGNKNSAGTVEEEECGRREGEGKGKGGWEHKEENGKEDKKGRENETGRKGKDGIRVV